MSSALHAIKGVSPLNHDIEMETGTGNRLGGLR